MEYARRVEKVNRNTLQRLLMDPAATTSCGIVLTSEIAPQNVHRAVEKMHALYSDVIETFFEQNMPIFEELVAWKYEEAAVVTVTLQEGNIMDTHPLMYTSDPPSQWVVKDIFSHLTQSLADYCAIDRQKFKLAQRLS